MPPEPSPHVDDGCDLCGHAPHGIEPCQDVQGYPPYFYCRCNGVTDD